MTKPMSEFTTDLQHSGMPAKDLDETIEFYTKKLGFELAGLFHNGENRCSGCICMIWMSRTFIRKAGS